MPFKKLRAGILLSCVWALGAGGIAYFIALDRARGAADSVYRVCMYVEDSWRTAVLPPAEPSPNAGRDQNGNEIAKPAEQYAREMQSYEVQKRRYELRIAERQSTEPQRHEGCAQDRDRTMRERTQHIYSNTALFALAPLPIFWLVAYISRLLRRGNAGSA